jgi:shikimate kinase
MNIILIGYRGTGKSTIARIISQKLNRKLHVLDALISYSAGMSIQKIVAKWGWERFREMETFQIKHVANRAENTIIDCGGGVVLNPDNVSCLKQNGKVILLTAPLEIILKRIRPDSNRPALKDGVSFEEEQKLVLEEREPLYQKAADLVFETTSGSPEEKANQIIKAVTENGWLNDA